MASNGSELLQEHYEKDHLSHEEIENLDLKVVTENGASIAPGELQGKIFRIVDRDEPSAYVVNSTESTGTRTTLCYLQGAS